MALVNPEALLSTPRGVYPDAASAREAARRVPHGFVISAGEFKHVVYEALWQPLTRGRLIVDLEIDDDGAWRVVLAADDQALREQGAIQLEAIEARWLLYAGLPAAIALLDGQAAAHQHRTRSLQWEPR